MGYQQPWSSWAAQIRLSTAGARNGLEPTYWRKCSHSWRTCGWGIIFSMVAPTVECSRMARASRATDGSLGGRASMSPMPPRSL
ncbi:MAG: hypothetical protein KatS3mg103_0245 [Phycisphaerales bacterium]|nr:MAG: hypothetical protein KatS3mg103_0245 [Phycisphaerales bacterium]